MTIANKISCLVCLTALAAAAGGGAYGGFKAGAYLTAQEYQKSAIAHECARLNPKDNSFGWILPITMDTVEQEAIKALPKLKINR